MLPTDNITMADFMVTNNNAVSPSHRQRSTEVEMESVHLFVFFLFS